MATVKGAEGDSRVGERTWHKAVWWQMCLKCEVRWKCESEWEAITLHVVLIKKFFTLPFTIKNMKLWTNKKREIKHSYWVNKSKNKDHPQSIRSVAIKIPCDHHTQYSRNGVHILTETRSVRVGGTVRTKHWPCNYLAPVVNLCVLNQGWFSEHSGHQDSGCKIL